MNCPHCKNELPGGYAATFCPACGRDLSEETAPEFATGYVRWWLFFLILLTPALGSFISVAGRVVPLIIAFGPVGSLIAGLVCARMIMAHVSLQGFKRAMVHVVIALLLCGLSLFFAFVGCSAGSSVSPAVIL